MDIVASHNGHLVFTGQRSQSVSSYLSSRRLHQQGQDLLLKGPRVRPWTFSPSISLVSNLIWSHSFKHHLQADDSQIYNSTWLSKTYFRYSKFSWFSSWTLHFHAINNTSYPSNWSGPIFNPIANSLSSTIRFYTEFSPLPTTSTATNLVKPLSYLAQLTAMLSLTGLDPLQFFQFSS